jgi:thioredoxin 1
MTEALVNLNDGNFDKEVLQSETPVLVDFWAPWCGPCRTVGPIVEELAELYKGKAKIGKLNVDDNPNTAASYGVRSIPTLILFKGGKVLDTIIGVVSKDRLDEFVKRGF